MQYVDSNLPPFAKYTVPGGGSMFDTYTLNRIFEEADEVVSIAKNEKSCIYGHYAYNEKLCSVCLL